MPGIEFKADFYGQKAQAGLEGLNKQVKGVASNAAKLGGSIKSGIAGLVGTATVTALVHSMISFADEINNASERLGVATDKVQSFRIAAKRAGLDLAQFDKIFLNMEKSFGDALGGGEKMDILKRFGLSKEDVQTLNKADALEKIMGGSQGMSDQAARENLTKIFGGKNANSLMAMRGDILDGNKHRIISNDTIAQLDELGDSLEDLKDTVVEGLIPAFLEMVKYITENFSGFVDDSKINRKMADEAAAEFYNKNGRGSLLDDIGFFGTQGALGLNRLNPFASDAEKKANRDQIMKDYIVGAFGQDIYDKVNKDFEAPTSILDNLRKSQAESAKRRAERRKQLDAGVNRTATKQASPSSPWEVQSSFMPSANLGSADLVKIGGTLNVDAQYRMEKLQIQANVYLERMTKGIETLVNNGGGFSDDDNFPG